MSIRIKAALVIILIVFVITAVHFVISRYFTMHGLLETMGQEQSRTRDLADDLVGTKIGLLKSNASMAAESLLNARSEEDMRGIMQTYLEKDPDFLALTVFSREKTEASCGSPPTPESCLTDCPYLAAAFEGRRVLTATRIEPHAEPPLVFYVCVPMGQDKVLSVTVQGLYFYGLIEKYQLWKTGSVFIVDERGTLVAHYDVQRVLTQVNYIELAKTDPAMESVGTFFERIISSDEGVGTYVLHGEERVCSYRRISASTVGWTVAVSAPIRESPQIHAQRGLLLASTIFVILGSIAAVLLSYVAVLPFYKIEEQNRHLTKLNETNQTQAARIQGEHERIKLLLDAMPFGCSLWNKDLQVFDCNNEIVRLFGAKDAQELLTQFHDFSPEFQPDGRSSPDTARAVVQAAFENGKFVSEWVHQSSDGSQIPMEVTLVRVAYEGDYIVAVYLRDLREHKQMMEEIKWRDSLLNTVNQMAVVLLQSETDAFESNLVHCMGMIAKTIKVDRIRLWKNHTIEISDFSRSLLYEWLEDPKLQHSPDQTLDMLYSGNIPEWEKVLSSGKCIAGHFSTMSPVVQERLISQNIVSIVVVPILLQDQFWGFISYEDCSDGREFPENEQSILRTAGMVIVNTLLRNEVTQNLRTSAEQLEVALTDAQAANRAKSSFLARMSHEMRTPLNAVIGLCGLTLESSHLDNESYVNLEKIYNAGVVLLNTVNDILDISKIEAGRFELQPAEYELASLINDAVTQNVLRIGEKPVEFVLDIDESLPARLYGDELRVKQILNNLLSNAFKYTMEGTVTMNVACTREGDDVWLTLTVRDTGIGIRAEDTIQLFDDYVQVDKDTNRYLEGTGLGLSITKRMAEMMDGTITAESEYGLGSTFTVKLRQGFVSDAVLGPEMVKNLKNFRGSSGSKYDWSSRITRAKLPYAHVLVVDDNLTNLDVTQGMLAPYGMKVDCVTDGQSAIDAIRDEKVQYNAVFMDHMMPGMDGIEATRRIREIGTQYAKNIPIIALTANAVIGNEKMFLDNGFQAFLPKPVEVTRLDEILRHWVRDREQEALLTEQQINELNEHERRSVPERRSGIDRRQTRMKLTGLDVGKGIKRFDGNAETYYRVLRTYSSHTRSMLGSLENVSEENLSDFAIVVHGIKGASRGIFADMIGNAAESLENAARAGNFDYVVKHYQTFLEATRKLLDDLDAMFAEMDAKNKKPQKDKLDVEILAELMIACEHYDMDGVDSVMENIAEYEYTSDAELAAWLQDNVEKMNFAEIKDRLQALLGFSRRPAVGNLPSQSDDF